VVGLKLSFLCVSGVENREVGLKLQNHDSLRTVLFDLKEAELFLWVGQNAMTKSVIKPYYYCNFDLSFCTLINSLSKKM